MSFPTSFAKFLEDNHIQREIYNRDPAQYFFSCVGLESLREDAVGLAGVSECLEFPNFYRLERSIQFSSSSLYGEGKILPMDMSSGLAVRLLDLQPSDHLLDLCCAPGGKLVLASLLLKSEGEASFNTERPELNGTFTGVDLAEHRLSTCRSLVKKFKVPRVRLFCADGSHFDESICRFTTPDFNHDESVYRESLANKPFHESTEFRKRPISRGSLGLYDKVIVDAQCTHDGSIKHIRKQQSNSWRDFDFSQFEPERLQQLHALQLSLLENGFRLLKPGGILIYSTCSLSRGQNEEIALKFLATHNDAQPFPFSGSTDEAFLRHEPPVCESGFFIFRVSKTNKAVQ